MYRYFTRLCERVRRNGGDGGLSRHLAAGRLPRGPVPRRHPPQTVQRQAALKRVQKKLRYGAMQQV